MASKIEFENVTFRYQDDIMTFTALKEIRLTIGAGEFVSVIGPSGSGKSTLLSLLIGLNFPSSGRVLLDGIPITGPGPERGVVFQHYSLFPWLTARQNIIFGLQQVSRGQTHQQMGELADRFLNLVGLSGFKDQFPVRLSGGMQQRVAIARAFAMNPDILLMDEPFGAVDAKNRILLQEILLNLWENAQQQKTVVFVTHDIDEAIFLSDRIIVLSTDPGTVKAEIEVPFPRPRNRDYLVKTDAYLELRNRVLNLFYFYDELLQKVGGDEVVI